LKKILIINRGEIALRIIRACVELGLKSIACYSEADKDANYIKLADDSICIGSSQSKDSYLNTFNIINAALLKKVDAIHPGYGFLSENYNFAKLCRHYNLNFIGPGSESIKIMGNKSLARQIALSSGVPVIPGSYNTIDNVNVGLSIAKRIGFPIIIKANGGGGGKGMRLIQNEKTFFQEYFSASLEAEKSFNDKSLYIEKYIQNPKHIEIQVMGDSHGNLVHM
jgi:acetyl-CoA carboxylase, biotin carboxylase subunit